MSQHQILNPADHGTLRVHAGAGAEFGDGVMACLVVPAEFRAAQAHFPIVLRRDAGSGRLAALALFGFEAGENLFLAGDRWDATYRPLALSVQPFLVGRPAREGDVPQVHVDIGHPRIASGEEGTRVFDETGRPTPYLETIATQLGDLDHAWRESEAFFAMLERYELVEPFSLEVTLANGATHSLVGYQTIAEDRFAALDGEALHTLASAGHLLPIAMMIASLSQFSALLARKNAQDRHG